MTKCVNRPGIKLHYSIVDRDIHFNIYCYKSPINFSVYCDIIFGLFSVSLICDCQIMKTKQVTVARFCLHTSMSMYLTATVS